MMMGVPCVHMVVALKSGTVDGLNENNFMPTWWMISQMGLQYPVDILYEVSLVLKVSTQKEKIIYIDLSDIPDKLAATMLWGKNWVLHHKPSSSGPTS